MVRLTRCLRVDVPPKRQCRQLVCQTQQTGATMSTNKKPAAKKPAAKKSAARKAPAKKKAAKKAAPKAKPAAGAPVANVTLPEVKQAVVVYANDIKKQPLRKRVLAWFVG